MLYDGPGVASMQMLYSKFFSIHFYSYLTLLFVWVWNKPVSSDEISYSWKFPEQSPSLEHVKGLPMWIMYGEQRQERQASEEKN